MIDPTPNDPPTHGSPPPFAPPAWGRQTPTATGSGHDGWASPAPEAPTAPVPVLPGPPPAAEAGPMRSRHPFAAGAPTLDAAPPYGPPPGPDYTAAFSAPPPSPAPAPRPAPRRRSGAKTAAVALVAALALGVGGGTGFAVGSGWSERQEPTAARATTPVAGTGIDTPIVAAAEPVAAVARALSPAVVQIETGSGLGSGFVYDAEEGLVMTAAHVVDGAREVTVRTADGKALSAEVVGADGGTDIAVLRVASDGLTAAPLALGEQAEVGQLAVAIGSPFGLDQTVTSGVVSAVGRSVETPEGATSMIQTDAPINPGNSGGALADREGRVIGVNASIASDSGGNVGVGFAVPIETAMAVAERLVSGLPVTNGYLGVSASDATGDRAGARVAEVAASSPGGRAGIQAGDIITAVDGDRIASAADLVAAVRSRQPGTEVSLTIDRQGTETTVVTTLGEA